MRGIDLSAEQRAKLRARRAELGLTLEELAERCGVQTNSIWRILAGQHRVRPDLLRRLARELKLRCQISVEVQLGDICHRRRL